MEFPRITIHSSDEELTAEVLSGLPGDKPDCVMVRSDGIVWFLTLDQAREIGLAAEHYIEVAS